MESLSLTPMVLTVYNVQHNTVNTLHELAEKSYLLRSIEYKLIGLCKSSR